MSPNRPTKKRDTPETGPSSKESTQNTSNYIGEPTEEMMRRANTMFRASLPVADLRDWIAQVENNEKRQFAPEYSQEAFQTMVSKDRVIGDYTGRATPFVVSDVQRRHIITLLESLRREKDYKEETLYLAASLADRYLVEIKKAGRKYPNLILLAVICTLMAAKLE